VSGSAGAGAALGGALIAAAVIGGLVRALGRAAREAFTEATTALPTADVTHLRSVATLRAERNSVFGSTLWQSAAAALAPVEAAKVKMLASLTATPYFVPDRAALLQSLTRLQQAATLNELARAGQGLLSQLENGHLQILRQSLIVACGNAALKCGFGTTTAETAPDGTVRVIATDPAGRALVTEVATDTQGELLIATEVVGVSDGSCTAILDAFEEQLDAEGVGRGPGKRVFTGGVCELAAARHFIRSKVKPPVPAAPSGAASRQDESALRRRRLTTPALQRRSS
jgi:hypothetical protein